MTFHSVHTESGRRGKEGSVVFVASQLGNDIQEDVKELMWSSEVSELMPKDVYFHSASLQCIEAASVSCPLFKTIT